MASIAQPRPAAPAKARNPQFRTPVFVAGVAIALLAFLIMFAFGLVFANRSGGGQVRVVVAAEPIAARDPIDPGALHSAASSYMPMGRAELPAEFAKVAAGRDTDVLTFVRRYASWDRESWHAGAGYAVSVHQRPD